MRFHRAQPIVFVLLMTAVACSAQTPPPPVQAEVAAERYPWLAEWDGGLPPLVPLEARFPTPSGLTRVEVPESGFAAWLRGLPVRTDRSTIHSFRGRPLPGRAAAIVALDLGRGDLQQCADSIVRLHAEHLWVAGRADDAGYHFTSGFLSSWQRWVQGERIQVRGSRVATSPGPERTADHASFRAWQQQLFIYAGTLSMKRDSRAVAADEPLAAGDFFVDPGSPGHAVMILDVAEHPDGRRLALIGQGYTPAQDFHVIRSFRDEVMDDVWFPLPASVGDALDVPTWSPFPRRSARRFREPGEAVR